MNDGTTGPSIREWRDWVGTLARLILGGVFAYAAITKITNIPRFILDVRAYQLLPLPLTDAVGYVLPVVELVAAVLLLTGLLTRGVAGVFLAFLLAFIGGIGWVWSQGISIDCGCFGHGGEVHPSQTQYPQKIVENLVLAGLCVWLLVRPRTLASLDQMLFGEPASPTLDSGEVPNISAESSH